MGGPVAAAAAGVYGLVGTVAWQARSRRRGRSRAGAYAIEVVSMLAAELRAGGPLDQLTVEKAARNATVPEATWRLTAAFRISDRLGAPLAALLDRVDADLRAGRRLRLAVEAQTSGCRATSTLLTALPIAGLALGAVLGARPVDQLLHTPVGAGCAFGALALQVIGLAWTSRMVHTAGEAI